MEWFHPCPLHLGEAPSEPIMHYRPPKPAPMKALSLELCSPNALPKHNGQALDHSIVHFEVLIHSNADHRSLLKPILQHILWS
jgi:hypothetical protein